MSSLLSENSFPSAPGRRAFGGGRAGGAGAAHAAVCAVRRSLRSLRVDRHCSCHVSLLGFPIDRWIFPSENFTHHFFHKLCFNLHHFWRFFFWRYKIFETPPFSKKGEICSSPKPTLQKMIKKPSDLDSISSFWVTRAATSSWWAKVHHIYVWYIHKRFVSKKQLPFLGGEVRYQKIDGKKIYISPNLEDCHTIPYP